ncbi:DCC1-like thiol-disulfide oxidoreductase family protein [Thalassoglobus sp. JC818]|uniref:thiol-disulfide oxidoreductase DCC family protein n=1 Tax=Thalassoglobus sp. JC818 TaxID=3232136 RepID=UPI003457A0F0
MNSSVESPNDETAPIVFFDGVCGFCNGTVDFLMKRDPDHHLRFAPLQGATAQKLLTEEQRNLDSIVFKESTDVWKKSAAIVRILWKIGGVWSFLGTLLWLVPFPIRDFFYGLIARVRYRIFGKREACRMPSEEERNVMLE